MTEETEVPITAETQNPAEEPTQKPEVVDQVSTGDDGPKADSTEATEKEAPEKTPEQKETERLRRQLTKAQRNNARLYAEAEQLRQYVPRPQPDQQQFDPSTLDNETLQRVIQQEAKKLAEREVASNQSKVATQRTISQGFKDFGEADFNEATETFVQEIGGLEDARGNVNPVVKAVLKLEDSHKIIKYLGDHPELAAELPSLDPFELGLKLADVRTQINTKPAIKAVSKAPDPARPLSAKSGSHGGFDIATASVEEIVAHAKATGARWVR